MDRQHKYNECVEKKGYKIINCLSCGYWHVHPMPSEKELDKYYKEKYYATLEGNYSMIDKINDPYGFCEMQYIEKLRIFDKLLPKELPRTFFDVGAGYGDFLRFMKKNGWDVWGIEPSEESCKVLREKDKTIDLKCAPFSELPNLDILPASVVNFQSVLEHLPNPYEALENIKRFILPGGILSIQEVPNDFSFLQNLLEKTVLKENTDKHKYWVSPPDHLNYWTIESFKRFLNKCGFEIVHIISNFPIELFPLMGIDYVSNPEVGREMHLMRVKMEKWFHETHNLDFKDKLYGAFTDIGIGRDFNVYAKLKDR